MKNDNNGNEIVDYRINILITAMVFGMIGICSNSMRNLKMIVSGI